MANCTLYNNPTTQTVHGPPTFGLNTKACAVGVYENNTQVLQTCAGNKTVGLFDGGCFAYVNLTSVNDPQIPDCLAAAGVPYACEALTPGQTTPVSLVPTATRTAAVTPTSTPGAAAKGGVSKVGLVVGVLVGVGAVFGLGC
ncbi:hypothetical protein GLAREA_08909 [Glarea lozoyensis ATCC 20868]|uniref:Uncharacterized protein n=1 Tax=Glarea lozoyensis (strain ATCC 20868 / MF5171) TaxID=1116229 RepID=S3DXV6_GLAL2|nr:uncharacterized protein GLAREA_08909 [Glarea lozoyensis ATCC 20868]EPE36746.1 hypothetical protein GLAREA_08909 [Glarea lozoyensis ATCC 20868]